MAVTDEWRQATAQQVRDTDARRHGQRIHSRSLRLRRYDSLVTDVDDAERRALLDDTRRRAAVGRRTLVVADITAAALSLILVAVISGSVPRPATLLLAVVVIGAGKFSGLYDRDQVRLRKSTLEEVPALFQLAGLCALVLWLGDGMVFDGVLNRPDVVALWVLLFTTLACGRMVARGFVSRFVSVERCLIVGEPGAMSEVADKLAGRRAQVVGRVPLRDRRKQARDSHSSELRPPTSRRSSSAPAPTA